jgi:hypothetical protein
MRGGLPAADHGCALSQRRITMYRLLLRALAPGFLAATAISTTADAHCFTGARFFPATLNTDDPCVADELSIPTVSLFKNGDDPSVRQLDISVDFSKRITENFGISVNRTWTQLMPNGTVSLTGFQNLETSFQYQLYKDGPHEFALLASVSVEWGATGAQVVGADRFNTITPTLSFGKGFGDLPDGFGWFRAFALTGQVGYSMPTSASTMLVDPDTGDISFQNNPNFLRYSGSLQFSMPYLKANIVDLGLPDFFNRLIPIVEGQFQTPVRNFADSTVTTGTVNPGVIWVGDTFQFGVEAIIPINRQSGTGIGGMAQLHLYLDDMFPTTIGRPLFGSASSPQKPSFGN